jgi:hypothetical protein
MKMRASEALMLGSTLRRQIFNLRYNTDGGACALGMIDVALGVTAEEYYNWLSIPVSIQHCPICHEESSYISNLVIHMNDQHFCSPDEIARFLESVDPTPKESAEEVTQEVPKLTTVHG